ncbi:MAG: hypothetical protein MUF83_08240 [Acidimicrobiales bacterium]|jgi:hypothetical protein|nr:hypothetical protein [Acidimicrobiales bacterium]
MEKVIYTLVTPTGSDIASLRDRLCGDTTEQLLALGAHGVQVNVADDDVAPAAALRMDGSGRPADAIVSVWLDSAVHRFRQPVDDALSEVGDSMAAYLVTESVPIPNTRFPAAAGTRTDGMAQVAFLHRPPDQAVADWLDVWLNSHTQVAIDTQDTFLYVQNVVARVLTEGAPPWSGIVEEGFPAGAMTEPHVFFDAVDDEDRLAAHMQQMMVSTQRFLDYATLDVVPTSRYVMRAVPAAS